MLRHSVAAIRKLALSAWKLSTSKLMSSLLAGGYSSRAPSSNRSLTHADACFDAPAPAAGATHPHRQLQYSIRCQLPTPHRHALRSTAASQTLRRHGQPIQRLSTTTSPTRYAHQLTHTHTAHSPPTTLLPCRLRAHSVRHPSRARNSSWPPSSTGSASKALEGQVRQHRRARRGARRLGRRFAQSRMDGRADRVHPRVPASALIAGFCRFRASAAEGGARLPPQVV